MKIGITCYPTYGGSGVVATELGIELAARGHEIHFITYSQPFRLSGRESNIHFHEVAVSNYPLFEHPPYDLALATRMAEVAEFYSLNLLHVHYAIPHSVSALLARQMLATRGIHLPFITTLHGTDITLVGLDRSYLPITKFGIEESDGVTSISSYLRDRTRDAFAITSEIEVIRNFVNCDVYFRDPELVAKMRPRFAESNERLLVHLSNFRPVKRIQDVVKVFARVAKAMPARLMLIGDGPDRSVAEYLAREYDVQDRIHFIGKQDNVNELLPLADLMLMPSEMESFGLAALEAMACSVPTIGTLVGGVPELIEDGHNGLLFKVGDVDSMSTAAIALLGDQQRLEAMARAGRKTAQDHFCASRVIPLYEDYYDRVIARTASSTM
ncbi:N-acetyl-alpha-D-glucosaminyl L-malate synthase BshA [Tunturiibacter gelidoferens]|jgi:N-acetyl-alpha-D-glucosaminyl L-malate synthase BshA|uniref:N-acetyl-alpha-D-glucosaminyl L-malate synthase BshA n=1 Tax=Tunturiibacter gelidiferens TaxID=3069689 RepID=A0A9X0QJ62_9BACT|nr:N-acetyl-alpha-D-glucosaminyl L-malate synthase BshA [Edaphobacter lichenicola]MBB5331310.1 N-acetyl-alpha-D-glucosaminyl L-malate synthase BshA [Edaphobacter lichenicola]